MHIPSSLVTSFPPAAGSSKQATMADEKKVDNTPPPRPQAVVEEEDGLDERPRTMAEATRKLWTPKKLALAVVG